MLGLTRALHQLQLYSELLCVTVLLRLTAADRDIVLLLASQFWDKFGILKITNLVWPPLQSVLLWSSSAAVKIGKQSAAFHQPPPTVFSDNYACAPSNSLTCWGQRVDFKLMKSSDVLNITCL